MAQSITVENIGFNVLLEGPSDGALVILIHALMANLHMWDATVTALHNGGFATLRYDHVGHGETPFPPNQATDAYDFDDFCRHIQLLLEATGRKKAHAIVGCSMGGVVALRFGMLYPSLVNKVMSCDAPGGGMKALASGKKLWRDRVASFRAEGVEPLARSTADRWFPDSCPAEIKAAALAMARTCSLEGYEACAHAIQDFDYEGDMDRIVAPTMVLVGAEDMSIGPLDEVRRVADRIKGSEWVIMEGTGHQPPMQKAPDFNKIMLDFLQKA